MKEVREVRPERIERKRKICLSESITPENVKYFGEMMAICAMKSFASYSARVDFDRLYKGLLLDIARPYNQKKTVSDGYDFAQDAIVFLCAHFGKKLNDLLYVDKNGKPISVKKACLRTVSRAINAMFRGYRNLLNVDEFYHLEAPDSLEIDEPATDEAGSKYDEDYDAIDNTIKALGLDGRQREALLCRMSGMSYPEAARYLSIGTSTVWDIIAKIRKIYISIYSEPRLRVRR
ncbi:MAG: hypothetical protein FWD58_02865 [Firmicutes bacterium]|nr:hypothetical protein [Bacillota bacterium]